MLILLLGLLSGPLVYAAEACPVDSVITYDQDGNPTSRLSYVYDQEGRQIETVGYKLSNSIWIGYVRNTTIYTASGKVAETASWNWNNNTWEGNTKSAYTYDTNSRTLSESTFSGWADNDWVGTTRKEYQYDSKGNRTNIATFSWSTTAKDWSPNNKYEYVFDSQNRQTEIKYYVGQNGVWTPKTWQEYAYDEYGNLSLNRYWNGYNTSTSKWIGESWQNTTYNKQGKPIIKEQYTWENGSWKGTSKIEQDYNSSGQQIININYIWNPSNASFDKYTETYYDYDQWNNAILIEQYKWDDNKRVGQVKVRYEYTAYNSDPIMTATFQWDDTQNIFIGVDSTRIAKDAADNLILDEQYTWSANDWVGTKKEEYTYDANKLILSTIAYKWNVVTNTWDYSTKVLADYDSHKNQTKDERYQWTADAALPEGGYWKGTKYEVTTYNDKNVETDKITYQWDDANRRWLGNSKSIYEFDAANHLILEEQYTWSLDPANPDGGFWQGTKKEEFGYNTANQQTKAITYEWSNAINDWIGKTKVLSDYDSNKNQTLNEQYTWTIDDSPEGGYWHGTIKEEYTFNKNKQQTSSLIYAWNDTQRNWDYVSKTKSEYDTKKNLTLDERYEWQNGAWIGTLKKEYAYNTQGQQTMFAFYAWDETKGAFVGTQKEETELDAEGRTVLHATYTWGTTDWIGKSKNEYTYTTTNQIATDIVSLWSNNKWTYSTKTENTYTDNVLTSYIQYNWVNNAWVAATRWEQVDADTERSYEWWNNNWSITQEKAKSYDDQARLVSESMQNWQHGVQTSGSKTEYTYIGDKLTQKSSYIFESDWVETDRTTYTYSGNIVETISSTWTGTAWQGVERLVQEYSNERDYTVTQYEWKNGGWSGVSKTGYTYYADEKEKSVIIYRWSGTQWVEDTKTEYEYSGTKNIVTAMYQMEKGTWVGQSKVGNYYDEGEDLTTATWTWNNGAWTPNTKLGESHDADGNLTGQTTYSKKGNDFIYSTKTEYEYGATTKDKTTATYKWNTTTNAWQGISKSGVTYNGAKIASETSYTWISGLTWQPNQKKEYEYGVQAKDLTTAVYQWVNGAWQGVSKSGVTYASNGKIASEFSYIWNGMDWAGVTKTEYEYGEGKNNSVATYKGSGAEWVGVSKTSEVYTATGDSLGFYTYCWKDNAWADSLKQEFTYDNHGNTILHIFAQWKNNEWTNLTTSTKWEIEYNENDSIILDAHYTWNKKKGWVGKGKKNEYDYDNYGNIIMNISYSWDSNRGWVYFSKTLRKFDAMGRVLLYEYLTYSNGWYGVQKSEFGYTPSGIQSMSAYYQWNETRKDWGGIQKMEDIYDENDNLIGNITYTWNYTDWMWNGGKKKEYIYDEKGRILQQLESSFNVTLGEWENSNRITNTYDEYDRLIESDNEKWYDSKWNLLSQSQTIYDLNSKDRLRYTLYAKWEDNVVQTYQMETYYYHCDPKFTITVNTQEEGVGEVTGSGVYTYYARPQIAAVEDPNCYIFNQWTDGDINATRRILVTEDATYTAQFTPIERTINASVKNKFGGSVKIQKNN